ncbi:hypothetical protein HYT74_02980 [Candidatus Daviesbacteria bacterium]|nr:hypothetical protein [Candidatus Daviesbacteria bacterium]MBI4038570.1 hypothetical protein [Candidatus Daviesbacteria bacterium]
METIFFQTSLIAAFVAGMVALFAPCCITFLLPAYLGSVFKEKEKVLLMTVIFGLGIFATLLPAVLGIALISKALFRYHDAIYLIGGAVMIAMSAVTFLGLKLPMPKLPQTNNSSRTDVLSIFTMGIVSGITSACCAPVLIGILTLTFLSPSFFGALAVGGSYVLGMITPLLLISLFLTNKMPKFTLLRKPITQLRFWGREYPILLGNVVAAVIFLITGITSLTLLSTGQLSSEGMEVFTKFIQNSGAFINQLFGNSPLINLGFGVFLVLFIFLIAKKL